jgi:RNA polymerase sigma-70 factor, ECF subfamily
MSATLCSVFIRPASDGVRIARALRERDSDGLDALVEEYGDRLLRYLVHLTGERDLARDLFQETWVRVLDRGRQYDPRRPFVAWLMTIARNLAIDLLRKRRPLSLEALEASDDAGPPRTVARDTGPSPFDALAERERWDRVRALLGGVPARYREVLFLRFVEGMSLQEIAEVTGRAVPTVKSRLYRGLDQLALRLEGKG